MSQWPRGTHADQPEPYRTPTSKARTVQEARRPIQTSKKSGHAEGGRK